MIEKKMTPNELKLSILADAEFNGLDQQQADQKVRTMLSQSGFDLTKPFLVAKGMNFPVHVYVQAEGLFRPATPQEQAKSQPKSSIEIVD